MKIIYAILLIIGITIGVAFALTARKSGGVVNTIKDIKEEAHPSVTQTTLEKKKNYERYHEIENPGGFVNTNGKPITIGEYVGKKIILLDVMTYSCINCQRTFPYANSWYEKYKDKGLVIIGIHTPEFAFEHDIGNVTKAMEKFGIKFPVVLDNDYGTWNAYGNSYWPRKYLIDIDGYVVYDHIGEGNYDKTESKIVSLLDERAKRLGEPDVVMALDKNLNNEYHLPAFVDISPETYFGSRRNEYFGNGKKYTYGIQNLSAPESIDDNKFYLNGSWNFSNENATSTSETSSIIYKYKSKDVYFVASAKNGIKARILIDNKPITNDIKGVDVDSNGYIYIKDNRLYDIVHGVDYKSHTLKIEIEGTGLDAYTFTFG